MAPNDYDGGIDFIVTGSLMGQKNRFVRTAFSIDDLISFFKHNNNDNIKMKGSKSAVQIFKRLAKKIDPEDNPIVMIMKLK